MDPTQLLPGDVLADILCRLAPRDLALCRCVCKAWCATIDDRRLLHADLLPLSMAGIFTLCTGLEPRNYFSRPSYKKNANRFDYLDRRDSLLVISDHCNSLLLIDGRLVNPTTRQWARLPPPPPPSTPGMDSYDDNVFLVFDPTISLQYQVLVIHGLPEHPAEEELEWPPSPYVFRVFSSRTREREEKPFTRQGDAAGTIASMQSGRTSLSSCVAYWRGALYVQQHDFLMRITLSNNKYQVSKLPNEEANELYLPEYHLGKSKKGVYFAFFGFRFELWIWFLNESCDQMEWVLKKKINLMRLLVNFPWKDDDGPWKQYRCNEDDMNNKASMQVEFEWDSDDDGISEIQEIAKKSTPCNDISILGFHPNKEIVFLHAHSTRQRVLAYHVDSSKIEDLGPFYVKDIHVSFPFTPCGMGELSNNK